MSLAGDGPLGERVKSDFPTAEPGVGRQRLVESIQERKAFLEFPVLPEPVGLGKRRRAAGSPEGWT